MLSLTYTSHATKEMSDDELFGLLEQARKFNKENNITGLLCYLEGRFIQVLEGEKKIVSDLFERISRDFRHRKVTTILEGNLKDRMFSDWSMGFRRITQQEFTQLTGFKDIDEFFAKDPTESGNSRAMTFLRLFYGLHKEGR